MLSATDDRNVAPKIANCLSEFNTTYFSSVCNISEIQYLIGYKKKTETEV